MSCYFKIYAILLCYILCSSGHFPLVQKQQQPSPIFIGCGGNNTGNPPFQHQSIRNVDPSSSPPDSNPNIC